MRVGNPYREEIWLVDIPSTTITEAQIWLTSVLKSSVEGRCRKPGEEKVSHLCSPLLSKYTTDCTLPLFQLTGNILFWKDRKFFSDSFNITILHKIWKNISALIVYLTGFKRYL